MVSLDRSDLDNILEEAVHEVGTSDQRNVMINFQPRSGRMVMASDLLKDVFTNIIGNAIKHSVGQVIVGINIKKVGTGRKAYYQAVIDDNGPGIPDETKNILFSRLQQGDTKAHGRGLGLYLVKRLVDDYSGEVSVEDRVPGDHTKGAKFVVLLPVASASSDHAVTM